MKFKRRQIGRLMPKRDIANPARGVFSRRALVLLGVQGAVLGTLGRRLYDLQVCNGSHLSELAARNRTSKRLLAPARGTMVDRFGLQLASNKVSWRAVLMPEETTDLSGTIAKFSEIVPLDDRDQVRIVRDLKHVRKYVPVTLKDFLSWDEMARIELNAPGLPGVLIDIGSSRQYSYGELAAHVVGYVAPPNEHDVAAEATLALPGMRVGRGGVEQSQDLVLRGTPGSVEMEVNARGRVMGELDRIEGSQGSALALTIDIGLQQMVRDRIGELFASAVVMDCRNGEVLAMVSTPSFNPSLFDSGVSREQWAQWASDPETPLIDKTVAGLYSPGSTFKPAVALAALKAGAVSPTDRFHCPGYYDMGGVRFHCYQRFGHGNVDMREAIKLSCDVYFYQVARATGMDPIKAMGNGFGLGTKLGLELPHIRTGVIPTPDWRRAHGFHWNGGDTVNSGIGQGFVQVTPMELATYVSRIASGRMIEPHLVRSLDGKADPRADLGAAPALDIAAEHLDVVRRGMFAVVNEQGGSGPKARLDIPGVQMAGKTGSAQVRGVSRALRETGHFKSADLPWQERPHALFIAFAPYDAPRYAVAVVIEHGNAGAEAAAPLARDIMTDTLNRDPVNHVRPPGDRVADNF